jgi:hypothetical protein
VQVSIPALSPAEIRSDPDAAKAVRLKLNCFKCGGNVGAYAGLERKPELEDEGFVWYENLPAAYRCSCGNANFDLTSWQRNLHGLLGLPRLFPDNSLVPMYEKGALRNIHTNFAALLQEAAGEQVYQKFIEDNPVLLHQFSPQKIFNKAPILSLRKTDFAIVNHESELILIELEKPTTKLLRTDGNIHHELTEALKQPCDWLNHADEHRGAVLKCIGVETKEVGAIHAVVVAGSDSGYDPEHLRMLKKETYHSGRTKVMTYDDLLANFGTLVRRVEVL